MHGGFARDMVRMDAALLQDVLQLLLLVGSAANMVPKVPALSNTAPLLYKQEAGVESMAVAAEKCAQ